MLEVEMVNDINRYLLRSGICYANEIRMGIGIPDISLNLGANKRIKLIDDYYLFSVLAFITYKNRTTFCEIQEEFNFSIEKVRKYVLQLVDMSFVRIKDEVVRIIKKIYEVKLGTTIAIEAKIKDWKNGIIQAQRYLTFSDYAFLALQKKYINNVDIEKLKKLGIGLLSVDGEEIAEIVPAVKLYECDFCMKYMHTSSILNKYIENTDKYIRKKINIFSKYEIYK